MRSISLAVTVLALTLTGCSQSHEESAAQMADAEAVAPIAIEEAKGAADASGKPLTQDGTSAPGQAAQAPRPPQIAYTYQFGFRIADEAITPLQQRHADLCESKGPQVCRIIAMEQSGSEGDYTHGKLELDVVANQARAFGKELGKIAKGEGGEEVNSAIAGEDLSKQIVDTEARLRARTLLRDRLMEILATRKGSVAELVEAERGVAQVNEEIDQAQSWLAEMKGRVAYSHMTVSYDSSAPGSGGFLHPIRNALGSLGSILGTVIAGIIVIVTALIPITFVVVFLIWGVRKLRALNRNWRGADKANDDTEKASGDSA